MQMNIEDGVVVPATYYEKDEYRETASGNKVCSKVTLGGTQNIILSGKTIVKRDVILRGDLCSIRTGKYCIIGERTIIRTSHKKYSSGLTFFPVYLGDHIFIEEDCVIMAAAVGCFVRIGRGSVLGRCCVIKDCCRVLPGSVVAPDSVFPPFSIIGGNPARIVGTAPECNQDLMVELTTSYYNNFLPKT